MTTQPSTYDIFALIELYGRKIQSGNVGSSVDILLLMITRTSGWSKVTNIYDQRQSNVPYGTRMSTFVTAYQLNFLGGLFIKDDNT